MRFEEKLGDADIWVGSIADLKGAHVAQSVEHVLGKDEVTGSIPVVGSRFRKGIGDSG